jgi:hypothetical protein
LAGAGYPTHVFRLLVFFPDDLAFYGPDGFILRGREPWKQQCHHERGAEHQRTLSHDCLRSSRVRLPNRVKLPPVCAALPYEAGRAAEVLESRVKRTAA